MDQDTPSAAHVITLALVVAVPLAGCVGQGGDGRFASFDDALQATGPVFEPVNGTSDLRLKLLVPSTTDGLTKGEQEVVVLLYRDPDPTPITDAQVALAAQMPAMGHGTNPEADPAHEAHGVYIGMTTWSMPGQWILNVDVTLSDGAVAAFDIPVQVGSSDGNAAPGEAKTFASFDEAMSAPGTTFDPAAGGFTDTTEGGAEVTDAAHSNDIPFTVQSTIADRIALTATLQAGTPADEITVTVRDPDGNDLDSATVTGSGEGTVEITDIPAAGDYNVAVTGRGIQASYNVTVDVHYPSDRPIKLKMLDPADPDQAQGGKQPIVFLLFNPDESEPITGADVTLKSWMPAMGHGTQGERDPTHQGHGVYEGRTNHVMGGEWTVNMTVAPPGQPPINFVVPYQVEG